MQIIGGKVFHSEGYFKEETVYIENDRITDEAEGEKINADGLYVIPGLTDIHFHACMGVDFCDGKESSIEKIAEYELSQGITQICPASMTFSEEKLTEVFHAAKNYKSDKGSVLVGINMEGPFISHEKKGAQNPAYIHNPNVAMFRRLQCTAGGLIKLCDIAPETEGGLAFVEEIADEVRVSLAHTAADYDTAAKAFELGARHCTHLYNAMPAFSHRKPGVVGAAAERDDVTVELICDGVHVHPSTVRATFRMFGDNRICMISDTMEAAGLQDGQYTLGGQEVFVNGRNATLKDGTLAGSVTNLMNCVRTAVKEMHIPLESVIKCAAVNPAKAIGIYDTYGSIEMGKKANLVLLDHDLNIVKVIYNGKVM